MKAMALKEQFVTDAGGRRVGVLLDLASYERLREAEEELADIQAYDTAQPKVAADVQAGRCVTLAECRTRRSGKAK